MARLYGTATATAEPLAAATAETVLQLVAPSNHRLVVKEWGVAFDGASGTAVPVLCELCIQDTAGTSSAGTVNKWNEGDNEALQATCRVDFTAEPTTSTVIHRTTCHPQQGILEQFPLLDEPIIIGGGRLGIRCTSPAIVNAVPYFKYEE